jgi:hypothetical protein
MLTSKLWVGWDGTVAVSVVAACANPSRDFLPSFEIRFAGTGRLSEYGGGAKTGHQSKRSGK